MKNKTLLTLCAASMLLSVNAMAEVKGAFTFEGNQVTIDENYTGENAFEGWEPGETKIFNHENFTLKFNRQFQANIPATIVFPISMQPPLAGDVTSNAEFYELQYVIPDFRNGNRTWLAKMKKIEIKYLAGNCAYAVIVPEGGPITINNIPKESGWIKAPDGNLNPYESRAFNENYNGDEQLQDLGVTLSVYNNAEDWYFVGTYENGTWSDGDGEVGLCYGFEGSNYDGGVHKGQFGKIANGTKKKAFRSYLCKANADVHLPLAKQSANGANMFSLPESINVEFVDTDANGKEHTTYVGKLNRIDNVRLNRERSTFDLKGRNVDGKRTAKGVYLKK